jgi:hypothetical protein
MTTDALEGRDLKAVVRNRPSRDHPVWTEPYPPPGEDRPGRRGGG